MTTEEKAKRYDEALNRCREFYETLGNAKLKEEVEEIFPELKDEDERIRKALKEYFINSFQNNGVAAICGIHIKDILAFLEKQGEQKNTWSEEDSDMVDDIVKSLKKYQLQMPNYRVELQMRWLKFLKDRVQPQNLTVTDEELIKARNEAYNDALDKLEYHSDTPTFNDGWSAAIWYLKKRNAQPQSTWKPSDEQMTSKAIDAKVEADLDPHGADYGIQRLKCEFGQLEALKIKNESKVKVIIIKEN